jgi:two-component system, response regulator, stage 0 sporulation protein F
VRSLGRRARKGDILETPIARILVVDDEESVREVLAEYFTEKGYEVSTAEDGRQALEVVDRERPHLVLLDIRMPGEDGVETLRRLRQVAPSVSIIMVTANNDVERARETLKLGALDYVAKPFDFVYLERAVLAGLGKVDEAAEMSVDPWRHVGHAVFHVARNMSERAWMSTGTPLEQAALRAAAEAANGRPEAALAALAETDLLLGIASKLRDLTDADVAAVQAALAHAEHDVASH